MRKADAAASVLERRERRGEDLDLLFMEQLWYAKPDAAGFRRGLNEALAKGFQIDARGAGGRTMLHSAANNFPAARAGLPQILIEAGADVNLKDGLGHTPLGRACWWYVDYGRMEYLGAINVLLSAGARLELDEKWKNYDWQDQDQRARRDRLNAYINTWPERRAAAGRRAEDAAPAFDYAL